ncbi:MAG TPA: hypothetical protein VF604_19360 [Pyrinomonadaceae bacterium]|jgi:hypothetical protein
MLRFFFSFAGVFARGAKAVAVKGGFLETEAGESARKFSILINMSLN